MLFCFSTKKPRMLAPRLEALKQRQCALSRRRPDPRILCVSILNPLLTRLTLLQMMMTEGGRERRREEEGTPHVRRALRFLRP
jgi:hypothetical protein